MIRTRTLFVALCLALGALALPTSAHASTISITDGAIFYTAAPGETNQLVISQAEGWVVFDEPFDAAAANGEIHYPDEHCDPIQAGDPGYVKCQTPAPLSGILANLDDQSDSVTTTVPVGHTLIGGNGDDNLTGGPGQDALFGDEGADTLTGGGEDDQFHGDQGLDIAPSVDTIDGGAGDYDTIFYDGATGPITLDLDAGTGGQIGAIDQLAGLETVFGSEHADTLIGDEHANTLVGNAGADHIDGETGADELVGNADGDTLHAGSDFDHDMLYGQGGDDALFAADGTDTIDVLDCGDDTDEATVDADDYTGPPDTCETITVDGDVDPPADTTAPVVELGHPADHSVTNAKRPAITGTAGNAPTDQDLYFELNKWNGSAWATHHTWNFPKPTTGTSFSTNVPIDLGDGTYHLRAYQSDSAGNHNPQDERTSRQFIVDTTGPVVELTSPGQLSTTTDKRPVVSGTAGNASGDSDLTFELHRWNGSSWSHMQNWTVSRPSGGNSFSTRVPVDLSPGTYFVRALQGDAAGNPNPLDVRSERQFSVEAFSNPPVLSIAAPMHDSWTNQRQPTIWGTSDTAGQVKVDLHRWNGSVWVIHDTYYANVQGGYWIVNVPSALPDGQYGPIAYQTNLAGQTGNAGGGYWFVDTAAPAKPRITSPANNTKVGSQTPTFSGTADSGAGTDQVYLEFQGYQNGKWVSLKTETVTRSGGNWSFKPSQWKFTEGYFAVFAWQYDKAGNLSISDGSQFQVDLNAQAPDNPGTSNDTCQKTLDYGPFHVEGECLKREGLTWVSTAKLTFNGLQLQPDGGGAKVILDPFNLRIAAKGNVKVVLGPKHLCLADPTRIISDTCFYTYTVGPFTLYRGEFDWSWQGKVQLPELPKFGLPAWGGVSLPQLPGLSGFNLPNLQIPDWGAVALPDFSKIKGLQIGTLSLPSLNAPNITLPDKYFGNFKFDLPSLSIGTSGATNLFGFPIEGRIGLQFVDQGIRIDAGLKLPSLLGGVVGDAKVFVGNSGNLLAENLHMGVGGAQMGPIGFRDLSIDYSAPNQLWEGATWIDLPVADGLAVRAGAGFKDGQLVNAEAGFEKNFPIASGLFLYGGTIWFKTVPRREVGGNISLGLGPIVKGASAVKATTGIKYKFAAPGYQSSFRFDGGVSVVSIPLGSGYVEIFEEGSIDFGGKFGKDFGNGFKAEAYVDGWINAPKKTFNVYGNGQVKLGELFKFDGEVNVSHIGAGGCAAIDSWGKQVKFGATYIWSTGAFNPMWSSCSIGDVKAKKSTARVAGARQTVSVPAGEKAYVMGFKGRAGAPEVTLTGPKGERVSTFGNGGVVNKDFLVVHVPEQNLTQVVLHEPAGGAWTVEVDDRSTPVDQILTAESIPTPKVTAKVRGKGYDRTLEYDTSDVQDGQRVTFVEIGPKGADHVLGEVGSGRGRLRFTPMAGPAGVRPIKAIVTDGGVMRFNLEKVASFRATKPGIPAAPRNVVARRKKGKRADTVTTTWTKVAGAAEYRVTVVLNGRRKLYETKRTRLKVPGLFDRSSARISVAGVNALGQAGKARKAKVAAPKAKHPPKKKR